MGPPDLDDDFSGSRAKSKRGFLRFPSIFATRRATDPDSVEIRATKAANDTGKGSTGSGSGKTGADRNRALNCNDCNRKLCINYGLPICEQAKEEEVFAVCFRMSCLSCHCLGCCLLLLDVVATAGMSLLTTDDGDRA
jgi:hypothetical protein